MMNSTLALLRITRKRFKIFVRRKNVWTSEKIVKSPFRDINIPDLPITEYMWTNLDKWANKTAVVCGVTKKEITYEQLFLQSRRLAANLKKIFKLRDGDNVAVILPNMPEYPLAVFGVLAAGGTVTTVNPVYTVYEIQRQILMSDSKLVIAHIDTVITVKKVFKMSNQYLPIVAVGLENGLPEQTVCFQELCDSKHTDLSILKAVRRHSDDVAFLPYSSGTTGLPKGVQLTHKNIIANCEQRNTEIKQYSDTTESNQDTAMCIMPMFHSYGLSEIMLHKLSVGLKLVTLPKFNTKDFLNILSTHKINLFYMVPPMIQYCGSSPDVTAKHLKYLTRVTNAGATITESEIYKFLNKTGGNGVFQHAYGLTETSPLATMTPVGFKDYTSVGYAVPNVELRVVNDKFENLGPNETGEILLNGPNVMKGYKNNPEANKEVFLEDRWLRSGDLGKIDETGALKIVGRMKELIKVKGYQVSPVELENVLKEHPAVYDAVVFGVPDSKSGELPVAYVILKDGAKTDCERVLEFVRKRVAPYKRIKDLYFVKDIPRNVSGKILRHVIKKNFISN